MNSEEMREALEAISKEKGVEVRQLAEALVLALESAYRSLPGAYEHARAELSLQTFRPVIYVRESDPETGEPIGEELDDTPDDEEFGRIAAQAFRQVMSQRVRHVVNTNKYEEYAGREGDIVTGIIQQSDSRFTLLNLGGVEALLPRSEQVPFEQLEPNTRVKAYLVEVRRSDRGPQIVVSRTHPGLIKRLLELEVPEVVDGIVDILACSREPGHRTKISVMSQDEKVDPVGACVGSRGSRVRVVVNELRGEKIDIIHYSDDPEEYIARALSPAKVKQIMIDAESNHAEVVVHDHQLSLAIGKEGQNARLAARLTGYHIEIKSETQAVEEQGLEGLSGEAVGGTMGATLDATPDDRDTMDAATEGGAAVVVEDDTESSGEVADAGAESSDQDPSSRNSGDQDPGGPNPSSQDPSSQNSRSRNSSSQE